MFLAYRIGYFAIAALFLANILSTEYVGAVPAVITALKLTSALALCGTLVLVVAFSRIHSAVFWITISAWQVLFVWYAWLSPGAPFTELVRDRAFAVCLFTALSAWFYSLAAVRTFCRRTQGGGSRPEKAPPATPGQPSVPR